MGKLKGMTFGKLKGQRKLSDEMSIVLLDFKKEMEDMEFECKIKGRELIAWLGSLTIMIRFTSTGNTVTTKLGARLQNGHEEKLDLKATYDYVSTKISNFLRDKDN